MSKAAAKPAQRRGPAERPAVQDYGPASAGDPYLPQQGNGGYRVDRYDVSLTYRVPTNYLIGRVRITAVAEMQLSRFSLDLAGLQVSKVKVNGERAAAFKQERTKLHIWPARPVKTGAGLDVVISYVGNPAPLAGRWGQIGWEELTDGVIVASQPNGAQTWFPCNDHPSSKAAYRITVTTDSAYRVIANGRLVEKRRAASQTSWTYDHPDPMAAYLATVQIGRYELFDFALGPVPSQAAVPAGRRAAVQAVFKRQSRMIELFSRLFGRYPFPSYTVVVTDDPLEIPLEAQGISIFGSNFVAAGRAAERLVAHELAHQWFGNSLTLDAWQHIWLHEGFACYAEWLWAENSGGLTANASAGVARSSLALRAQDLLIGDPGPGGMLDSRVYLRGALTVHELRLQMGDRAFFAMLQDWVHRNRHRSVNTAQFLSHAETHGGDPELLHRWLFEAALPN